MFPEGQTELLLPLFMFALAASITPGPNNILLTASGANFGFRRTIPHMLGISMGFLTLLLCIAFGLGVLFDQYPGLQNLLKIAGSMYLLYFAYRVATAGRSEEQKYRARPFTFLQAAGFQFVNPKAWMMAISAMTAFTLAGANYTLSALMVCLAFTLVNLPSVSVWALLGSMIGKLLKTQKAFRTFNIVMGVLTAASIGLLFL